MYRQLLFLTLCLHATSTAPQDDRQSEITYFKIQPVIKNNSEYEESNKELIITENPTLKSVVDVINKTETLKQSNISETEVLSEPITEVNDTKTDKRAAIVDNPPIVLEKHNTQSDSNESIVSSDKTEKNQNDDNVPSETKIEREARDFEDQTTSSYETESLNATEKSEEVIEDTKTSPKVAPKVSYFKKFGGYSYNKNYIENQGKRKFRSRCRCEKIWNCPKLQITVPRCPEEEFMCCF